MQRRSGHTLRLGYWGLGPRSTVSVTGLDAFRSPGRGQRSPLLPLYEGYPPWPLRAAPRPPRPPWSPRPLPPRSVDGASSGATLDAIAVLVSWSTRARLASGAASMVQRCGKGGCVVCGSLDGAVVDRSTVHAREVLSGLWRARTDRHTARHCSFSEMQGCVAMLRPHATPRSTHRSPTTAIARATAAHSPALLRPALRRTRFAPTPARHERSTRAAADVAYANVKTVGTYTGTVVVTREQGKNDKLVGWHAPYVGGSRLPLRSRALAAPSPPRPQPSSLPKGGSPLASEPSLSLSLSRARRPSCGRWGWSAWSCH